MEMIVGYRLIDELGAEIQKWGGTWGQCPAMPNPITLPTGEIIFGMEIDVPCNGFQLVNWMMEEPPVPVPQSITRRQCALELYAQQIILLDEALAMSKSADVPSAIASIFDAAVESGSMTLEQRTLAEIDFAAANYYRSNSLLSLMGLSDKQIDQFFVSASSR